MTGFGDSEVQFLKSDTLLGPKYFGCIRMVQLKFLYLMCLLEVVLSANDIKATAYSFTKEAEPFVKYYNLCYLCTFNLPMVVILARMTCLYKQFEQ